MGGPSWQFKKFADASSRPWYTQGWKDKLFAGFTNSGSINGDKSSTLFYFFTLAMQHGGVWVGNGMMPANSKASQRNDVNWIGTFAGGAAQTPVDASAGEMWPGDLETGRQFGRRIAVAAARWKP
jgi:multimeric flavodoxin WrbA